MKPILMNTEDVKAILANRKTVIRRLIKSAMLDWSFVELQTNPYQTGIRKNGEMYPHKVNGLYAVFDEEYSINFPMVKAPYQPGDVLYVRETWTSLVGSYLYKADQKPMKNPGKWQPSIHMPKEAARIFLQVTNVRVERLQDMRLSDCLAEGVRLSISEENDCVKAPPRAKERYAGVWNSSIKKSDLDKYGWDANPWVWVIGFERISKKEALTNA